MRCRSRAWKARLLAPVQPFENHLRLAPCFILVAAARDPQIEVELSVELWARVVVGEYIRELF